jgi:cytochrome o ubiquinol oxidase operon protein cyoD
MSGVGHKEDSGHGAGHGSLNSYVVGFLLSIVLTLVAYFMVTEQVLEGRTLLLGIVGLAVAQLLVQLIFFLHLGRESRPRWNLTVFFFMLIVLTILVAGTLWIMENLDYHMMSPMETDQYIMEEEGIYR